MDETFYIGIITRIVPNKSFGNISYIDPAISTKEMQSVSFNTQSKLPGLKKWRWLYGDRVKFSIGPSELYPEYQEAKIIECLGNDNLEKLTEIVRTQPTISGYVKKFDTQYFLKEVNTNIQLRFKASDIHITPEPESLITCESKGVDIENIRKDKYCLAVHMDYTEEFYAKLSAISAIGNSTVKGHITDIHDNTICVALDDFDLTGTIKVKNSADMESWRVGDSIFVWLTNLSSTRKTGEVHFGTCL